ncbi:unnamed protein product [Macrosiphum euphorbiae]|uniref:Uncharacterized protein n=1 Tax=Macrosiphum euphorbiae TaxID=13131 RepID=A0AAV0W134_9HEMI|nr:unnamed protein product [Macrosiphum euphorbiae]
MGGSFKTSFAKDVSMDNRCERWTWRKIWKMIYGPPPTHGRQLTWAELTADTEHHGFKGITLTETYFDSESGDALNPRGPTTVSQA